MKTDGVEWTQMFKAGRAVAFPRIRTDTLVRRPMISPNATTCENSVIQSRQLQSGSQPRTLKTNED